jgi:hypothetical protein
MLLLSLKTVNYVSARNAYLLVTQNPLLNPGDICDKNHCSIHDFNTSSTIDSEFD